MVVDVFFVYSSWCSAGLWIVTHTFCIYSPLSMNFFRVYALNETLYQDKLRKCLHSRLGPGRECTGHPCSWYHWLVHNYISHCLHFLTKFSFCFINHMHLPLNNVLDPQLSTLIPEESHLGSFMVIASYNMNFDCCELTHAHCLACCLLVCWESWQDNLQNVARNVQDWRQPVCWLWGTFYIIFSMSLIDQWNQCCYIHLTHLITVLYLQVLLTVNAFPLNRYWGMLPSRAMGDVAWGNR